MRLGTVTVPADSTLVFDHWTDQNGNTVANDACLSGDPSGTNGNITDLIAHFDSAKQAPEAQPQPIVSTDEDAAKTITLSGTDEDGDNLTFFIVTGPSHGTLGPIGALTCAGTAPRTCSANVTYTPDNDYNGFDIFSFKADDGTEGSYPAPVSMLVKAVNDTPVATDETKTMSEDGGPLSIDFGALLSDVETSDANLTYDITNPDPAKGSLSGAGPRRNFTPAANFNGTVDIDYTPTDRGDPDKCSAANPPCAAAKISAQKTVTVTVDAVNDAPSFTKGPDQTKDEDAGAQTVDDWATAISAGPNESNQTVDFQLTNDNNDLFSAQPQVAPNGTLTYTPAPNAYGNATVKVKAHDDGGTANGAQVTSAEQTFTINVVAVNDAPSFQKGDNQTVNE
ncbi:MAG: cadherin-like domain-containing protein, partial [Actinobacteria bacterium]|nr:cadherin-like domain-containing protein [Actinomycetota bacterium]